MFQHRITLLLSCLTNLILCSDVVWRYTNIQRHGGRISTRDVLSLEAVTKPENANSEDFVWTATTCNLSNSTGKVQFIDFWGGGSVMMSEPFGAQSLLLSCSNLLLFFGASM